MSTDKNEITSNILVAQSGGPTAAINATLAGVYRFASMNPSCQKIYGGRNGLEGILREDFVDLREKLKNENDIALLMQTPAAALGSCRLKVKDDATCKAFVEVMRKNGLNAFVYIGGNDSMDTVDKLSKYMEKNNIKDITVVGAPKTIDNDLVETDHCPGFGSAVKYIASTVSELALDCNVYTVKAVTIIEIMGRDAGWLTAGSALARLGGGKGPSLIYLCESAFSTEQFIEDVKGCLRKENAVIVCISEGIKDAAGKYISEYAGESGPIDSFGHSIIAGAAHVLEQLILEKIGCKVRAVELNLMQRCAAHIASKTDLLESKMLGMTAARAALDGESGVMASIKRTNDSPYSIEYRTVPVSMVANKVKAVPKEFITAGGTDVSDNMISYLKPLIQGENDVRYKDGIPEHIFL